MTDDAELPERARALLDFWFGPPGDPEREKHREIWFKSTTEFDDALRQNFLADYEAAAAGKLKSWEATPEGTLRPAAAARPGAAQYLSRHATHLRD